MKKITLSVLMLGVMLMLVSSVSAIEEQLVDDGCVITINDPEVGSYQNDDIFISWTTQDCMSSAYDVYYREGSCSLFPPLSWHTITSGLNDDEYYWESNFDEGEYCIKIEEAGFDGYGVMDGTFYIDNIDPIADANGPYECNEGSTIDLDASDSTDNYGIAEYLWDFDDDGEYNDASGVEVEYFCEDGNSIGEISLKVIDYAGNEDTDYSYVEINNLNPWNCNIEGPVEVALGFSVEFSGSAEDVAADLPLMYEWDFGDDTEDEGAEVEHTYTEPGIYTITLTALDGDGGYTTCTHDVDVVEPTLLPDQEVAAFYPLEADFGEFGNEFEHGVADGVCEKIIPGNPGLQVGTIDGRCVVNWNAPRPTNNEQGEHSVLIKVTNEEGDYEYYAFTITVYSWIIPLREGWNLISIPYVHETGNINDVILDPLYECLPDEDMYVVWSYQFNGEESAWLKSRKDGYGNLNEINPGHAYWVNLKEGCDGVKLKGFGQKLFTPPGIPPEIEAPFNHWMMIGRYGVVGTTLGEAGDLYKDTALASLFDGEKTLLAYYWYGFDVTDYLSPYQGFWAYVTDSEHETGTYSPDSNYWNN